MNTPRLILLVLAACLAGVPARGAPEDSGAAPAVEASARLDAVPRRDALSHGADQRYWVVQVFPPGNGVRATRSAVRYRDASDAASIWRRAALLNGRVTGLAHLARDAAVLMDDQSWLLVGPGGATTGPRLPGGAALLALGSDETTLFALAAGADPPTTQPEAPATGPAAGPEENRPVRLRALALVDGMWQDRGALPDEYPRDRPLKLAVFDARPMVAWLESRRAVRVARQGRDGAWSVDEPVATTFDLHDVALLGRTPTPTLWLAPIDGPGELRLRREQWGDPVPLRPELPLPAGAEVSRSATYFAGSVRVVVSADGKLSEQAYTLEGKPVGAPQELGRTPPPATKPVSGWSLLLMGVLAAVLAGMVFRGSDRSERDDDDARAARPGRGNAGTNGAGEDAGASAGLGTDGTGRSLVRDELLFAGGRRARLAPLPRRLAAGLIDLAPVVLVMGWYVPWTEAHAAQIAVQSERGLYWIVSALVLYLGHTTLGELIAGRSVGKVLTRLRVLSLIDGNPARTGQILVRNLLRPIDVFPGLPLAVLILFSPLRQRLGDVLAGTAVVADDRRVMQPLPTDQTAEPAE